MPVERKCEHKERVTFDVIGWRRPGERGHIQWCGDCGAIRESIGPGDTGWVQPKRDAVTA